MTIVMITIIRTITAIPTRMIMATGIITLIPAMIMTMVTRTGMADASRLRSSRFFTGA